MRAVPYKLVKVSAWQDIAAKLGNVKKEVDQATDFVKQIEQGNLEVRYNGDDQIDENNLLASSLISMRDRMKQFGIDEKQRNWVTEGLASFVDILRTKNDNLQELSDTIVSNLVRYMGANQGALYIINDDDPKDVFLEMTACYAYERKKFADRRIGLGEGMTGQVVLEKQTLYRTDIPNDFVKITSGLGAALPRHLIIVPLMLDHNVYGVVELASFEPIKAYQIDFVERLGESIAATISSVKGGERTRKLLEETQAQAEQMRSQEEEMRQNMEELTATQEEMHRVLKEVQGSEQYVTELLNASTDSIFTLDRDLKLLSYNKVFGATFENQGIAIGKGFDILTLYTPEEKIERRTLYNRVLRGETIEQTEHVTVMGMDNYFMVRQSPLYNKENEIIAMAIFARDVTELIKGRNQTEELLKQSQNTSEELKAQEEELRQNMEELSATQEEMQRILNEVQSKETYLNEVLNASQDAIFTVDTDMCLISFNKGFVDTVTAMGVTVGKGFNMLSFFDNDPVKKAEQHVLYTRALNGEHYEQTSEFNFDGNVTYHSSTFCPLRDADDEVFAVAVYGRDMTAVTKAQKETERLSAAAQQQNEELKAQEEELRQNMEELAATQEEMQRILNEVQSKEGYLTEVLNASHDAIFTVDKDLRIISFNKGFTESLSGMGLVLEKGDEILSIFSADPAKKAEQQAIFSRALGGERFEQTTEFDFNGTRTYHTSAFCPLRNADGEVFAVAVYGHDVTEVTVAHKERERLSAAAQQQNEELKAQEEELRQNMEELAATQEEMQRILNEVQSKEIYLNELINASSDSIFTVDKDLRLISANRTFAERIGQMGVAAEKGLDILFLFTDPKKKEKHRSQYLRALNGETFSVTNEFDFQGVIKYITSAYSPLRNADGAISGVAIFGKDVTDLTTARLEAERLAHAAQQQNEELKAQEEELRQNMEELAATQEEMQRILNEALSKERYMVDLINATKDSIITVDREYRVVHYNQALEQSYASNNIKVEKGFAMQNLFSAEEWPAFKANYDRVFAGENFEITQHYHSHGFDAWFTITYSPLRNEKDEIIAAAVFAKDVTKVMQAQLESEKNLEQTKELQFYYNSVIEGLGDSIVTVDLDFKIVVANEAFKRLFSKYGVKGDPGESLLDMAKGREEEFKQPYLQAFKGKTVEEPRRCHFDHFFHVYYHPMRNSKGEIIGACLIAHDVTARIREAEEYKARIAQLEKKLRVA